MTVATRPSRASLGQLWRYYQAGIVNTAFGYGLYAAFVAAGLNMYVAQIVAHVLGVMFNYLTYSRYAFADQSASKGRFILSYGLNYLLGLAGLLPQLACLLAVLIAGEGWRFAALALACKGAFSPRVIRRSVSSRSIR